MASNSSLKRFCQRFISLSLLLPALLLAEDNRQASFDLALDFDPQFLSEVNAELICNSGQPKRQDFRLTVTGSSRLELGQFKDNETICQLRVLLPDGYSVEYLSESDGKHQADEHGCHFTTVSYEHSNRCLIEITQNTVPLTVYKKWVGGTGQEPDVAVQLACGDQVFVESRFINEASPGGWEVGDIGMDGLNCDVSEKPGDTFVADQSDCQGLLLFPGRGAECTMVNTKIVKRIEMLNRYGKAIMILVMLVAGLIAVKRYV